MLELMIPSMSSTKLVCGERCGLEFSRALEDFEPRGGGGCLTAGSGKWFGRPDYVRNGSWLKVRANTSLMTAMTRNTPWFLSVLCGSFVLVPVSFESGSIPSYHKMASTMCTSPGNSPLFSAPLFSGTLLPPCA